MEDENVWLRSEAMAMLFNKDRRTIQDHLKNIFYILSLMLMVSMTLTSCKKEEKEKRIDYANGYYIGEVNGDGNPHGYGIYNWNTAPDTKESG